MSTTGLQASSLLYYNPHFKVLICRECQYSIQKSAIDSHLLKHKIYRSDRQNLLAEIAQLDLPEPEDVVQPSSTSPPIELLPVFQGYRCTIAGCRHLTVSEKRARRHWSEVHGLGESIPPFCEFTCTVNLQTFFRGTKISYFEISPPANTTVSVSANEEEDGFHLAHQSAVYDGFHLADQSEVDDGSHHDRMEVDTVTESSLPLQSITQNSLATGSAFQQPPISLDLETLTYFHHFVTATTHTLPGSSDYWQTKVASEALRHNGVMCGLLAISTCHLMVLSTDLSSTRFYAERQMMLSHELFSTIDDNTHSKMGQPISEPKDQSRAFLDQVMSLTRCAQWTTAEVSIDQANVGPPSIELIVDSIRGCMVPEPASSLPGIQEAGSHVDRHNTTQTSCRDRDSNSARDSTHSVLLNYLQELPFRMVETLGKPSSPDDLFATLSAIDALVECCESSLVSDDPETVWHAASEWLTRVSGRFNVLVTRYDPAAMVVLAHWAAVLVKRAEHAGCWFLKGARKGILRHIVKELSGTNPAVLCLVDGLLRNSND